MSDFIDHEAEGSDDDSLSSGEHPVSKKPRVDELQESTEEVGQEEQEEEEAAPADADAQPTEAVEEGEIASSEEEDEDSEDEEDEEEDDAKIAEEMRGFVVEEGEEDEDMPNRKKHKKKHRHEHTEDATAEGEPSEPREKHTKEHDSADEDLEDEDFDLLRENLGYEVRPKPRRVVRASSDEEDAAGDSERVKESLKEQLFEGPAEAPVEEAQPAPAAQDLAEEVDEEDEEDEMSNFIVGEDGLPVHQKVKTTIHGDPALEEAQDVFGVDFNFDDFITPEAEELSSDEEEEGHHFRRPALSGQKRSIFEVYDPTELERNFLTEGDSAIRVNDAPERFQLRALRSVPVIPSTEAQLQSEMGMTEAEFGQTDLDEEALFIQTALGRRPYSSQYEYEDNRQAGGAAGAVKLRLLSEARAAFTTPNAVKIIRDVLALIRNKQLEIPYIATYARDVYEGAESQQNDEWASGSTEATGFTIPQLWLIWMFDEKWTQLRNRKKQMVKLFERMRSYIDNYLDEEERRRRYIFRLVSDDDLG